MLTDRQHLYALIVCGGGGTRLWPKSRNKTPKQFLKLFQKQTLFQITYFRLRKFLPPNKIFIVTVSKDYKKTILAQIPQIPAENILVEPLRKNTAAAHGLGAMVIFNKDPESVIINAASDHLIDPDENYIKTMLAAASVAGSGDWLVCVGIRPTYPNTGYGYLKVGKKWGEIEGRTIYIRDAHIEKPDLNTAQRLLRSGEYLWNANHYVWGSNSFLKALKLHAFDVYSGLEKIGRVFGRPQENKILLKEYEKIPDISVDYAISEKAKNFLLIEANYKWTDIGDWKEVWTNLPKDKEGNVIIDGDEPGGRVINIDTTDALVHTDGRLIAMIDVDDIVIVDTKDALLVCSKSRAQNVKKIVEELKKEKQKDLL